MEVIESYANQYPEQGGQFRKMLEQGSRKHWHELAETLLGIIESTPGLRGNLMPLYEKFIRPVEGRLDEFKLVRIVHLAAEGLPSPYAQIEFLGGALKSVRGEQPRLLLRLLQGLRHLEVDDLHSAELILEEGNSQVRAKAEVEEAVYSQLYKLAFSFYRKKQEPKEFYSHALQYLAYPDVDADPRERLRLCCEMATAVLISDRMYNFSELLEIPALKSLRDSEHRFLYQLLEALNRGSVAELEAVLAGHRAQVEADPLLRGSLPLLQDKIRVMAFLELLFAKSKGQRRVPFREVARACVLAEEGVERVVMKAMALGLVRGRIDQVAKEVAVAWVAPRLLDQEGIALMAQKYRHWSQEVGALGALGVFRR
jgi:26S proteasome regulatory subunit N9